MTKQDKIIQALDHLGSQVATMSKGVLLHDITRMIMEDVTYQEICEAIAQNSLNQMQE